MSNQKNDSFFIKKMIDDIDYIASILKDDEIEEFSSNQMMSDSTVFRLIQISENARKLSEAFRERHAVIPWTAITGLRNRIVHDYGNVNLEIIYDTLKKDIPKLTEMIKEELS